MPPDPTKLIRGRTDVLSADEAGTVQPALERQYRRLLHAREHGTVARREYAALTGVSERTALNDLADRVRKRLLEPTGGRGWRTAYRVRNGEG